MNRLITIGLALFFSFFAYAEMPSAKLPPKITLKVPPEAAIEGRDLTLYITIVRDPKQKVDLSSFRLEEEPLEVSVVQEEVVAPKKLFKDDAEAGLLVEKFRATLPKRAAGVYSIGPVFVRVGGVRYHSGSITVYVQGAVSSENFRLEAEVHSPPKIFPGQEVLFEYRIFYSVPLQVLREELPLLQVSGFHNIGSPQITDESSGTENIQLIRQKARALTPGPIAVGQSLMESMQMRDNLLVPPLMRAIAQPIQLDVHPFPEKAKPLFFDGAIGSFVWRSAHTDGPEVKVGQKVQIEYRVSGRGVLETVTFPSLDRLTGLKESFWATDPVGKIENGTKNFVLEVRPRRAGEEVEVPGFLFASFDPVSEKYLTRTIPPVVLKVSGAETVEPPSTEGELAPPFEIEEEKTKRFSPLLILFVLIGAIGIGIAQFIFLKKRKKEIKAFSSKELFYQAVMHRSKRTEGLQLLKKALYLRLFELGVTPTVQESSEGIREEGILVDVKNMLRLIDRELYHKEKVNLQEVYDEASLLYHKLKQLR